MSEPAETQEPEDLVDAAPDGEAPPADAQPDVEDRALAMGWTPKAQFRGDADKWVDAATFVKRGEEFLPFLKANNKRLEQALDRSEKKIGSLEKTLERFAEHNSKTEQRAYERAYRDIQARLDEAAALGDVQGVRAATEELVGLTKEVAAPNVEKAAPQPDASFDEWIEENPWWTKDKVMTAAAIAIANDIEATEGMNGGPRFYAEVSKRLKAEMPHKFENPRRQTASTVEGGGQAPRRAGKTYADLPADAKAVCDDFVKRVPGFTREKYCKDFFG